MSREIQTHIRTLLILVYLWLCGQSFAELHSLKDVAHLHQLVIRATFLWAAIRMRPAPGVDTSAQAVILTALHFALPLFLDPATVSTSPLFKAGVLLSSLGFTLSAFGVIDLGTSFALLPSQTPLVQKGAYAWIRNPIYSGYLLLMAGAVMSAPTWLNLFIFVAFLLLTHLRIRLEERQLSANPEYVSYRNRVRYRLVPRVY